MFLAIILGSLGFILYQILSFLGGTSSAARQFRKDLRMLRRQLGDFREGLIPFDMEEYRIASSSPVIKYKRRGSATIVRGFLSTIYQEPIMAFALKDQLRHNRLMLVTESESDEFIFVLRDKETLVKHNGKDLGSINEAGQLRDTNGAVIGQLNDSDNVSYQKIIVSDRDVAHMNVYDNGASSESDRMFSLFHDFLPEDHEEVLALSLYNLLIKPRLA